MIKSEHGANTVEQLAKKHKTTKRRQARRLFYVKNHYFAKRNHANSKPTARNGGFLLYRKRIIKKKP